jgi:hypothetical protein
MSADMYPRPSREQIAEQVKAAAPATPEASAALGNFAVHLAARMRALGWDQATLQEKAGISDRIAAKAMNGTGVDLGLAGKLAGIVGGYLATMIGPYLCATCAGAPPPGYACLECGTETRPS